MPALTVTARTPAQFSQFQALVDRANTYIGARIAFIADPTITDSLKWPYFALPPVLHVASEAQMLAQHIAYWGELPGAVAIRSDTNTAHRLIAADWKQLASWANYSEFDIVPTRAQLPLQPPRGRVAFVPVIGWHVFEQGAGWRLLTSDTFGRHFNREMLNRIRKDSRSLLYPASGPPAPFLENDEMFWDLFSQQSLGLGERRYSFTPLAIGGGRLRHSVAYAYPGTAVPALSGTIQFQRMFGDYFGGTPERLKFRCRVRSPAPLTFTPAQTGTINLYPAATPTRAAVGVLVEPINGFPVSVLSFDLPAVAAGGFATGTITLNFNGAIQPGDSGFDLIVVNGDQWGFPTQGFATPELLDLYTVYRTDPAGHFVLQLSTSARRDFPIIHPKEPGSICEFPFGDASPAIAWQQDSRRLLPGFVQFPREGKYWQDDTITPINYTATPSGGFFLAKSPLRAGQNFDPADRRTAGAQLVLAPNARQPLSFGSTSVSRVAEFMLPRYPTLKTTDSPNFRTVERPPPGSGVKIEAGCLVTELYLRRRVTGPDGTPAHWAALPISVGVIRNLQFAAFDTFTIPADARDLVVDVEWLVFADATLVIGYPPVTLAYQSSEEVEIQARVTAPDPDVNPSTGSDYLDGGAQTPPINQPGVIVPIVRGLIASNHYNDTAALVERLALA